MNYCNHEIGSEYIENYRTKKPEYKPLPTKEQTRLLIEHQRKVRQSLLEQKARREKD